VFNSQSLKKECSNIKPFYYNSFNNKKTYEDTYEDKSYFKYKWYMMVNVGTFKRR